LESDNASDHRSAEALAAIQNAGFELLRHPLDIGVGIAWHMASWKTRKNNSSTTVSERWRNAGPGAF